MYLYKIFLSANDLTALRPWLWAIIHTVITGF